MDPKAFYKLSYGLYVVASTFDGKHNGQIANTVFQISVDPPTIAVSINKNNLTNTYIRNSKSFSVSILPQTVPLDFIGHFGFKSGRDMDKFQCISFRQGQTGVPILMENSLAYLEAEVIDSLDVGTHTVFIGKVINSEVLGDGEPMTYPYYFQVKSGATPASAPIPAATGTEHTKGQTDSKSDSSQLKKYECSVCGYVYDPEIGDPDSGIAPGTPFEDLPDDWVCPLCGVSKSEFNPVS